MYNIMPADEFFSAFANQYSTPLHRKVVAKMINLYCQSLSTDPKNDIMVLTADDLDSIIDSGDPECTSEMIDAAIRDIAAQSIWYPHYCRGQYQETVVHLLDSVSLHYNPNGALMSCTYGLCAEVHDYLVGGQDAIDRYFGVDQ